MRGGGDRAREWTAASEGPGTDSLDPQGARDRGAVAIDPRAGDRARSIAARQLLLVPANPSGRASPFRLLRLRGKVFDDAIAGDERIISAQ